jgi:hypothetical protein
MGVERWPDLGIEQIGTLDIADHLNKFDQPEPPYVRVRSVPRSPRGGGWREVRSEPRWGDRGPQATLERPVPVDGVMMADGGG